MHGITMKDNSFLTISLIFLFLSIEGVWVGGVFSFLVLLSLLAISLFLIKSLPHPRYHSILLLPLYYPPNLRTFVLPTLYPQAPPRHPFPLTTKNVNKRKCHWIENNWQVFTNKQASTFSFTRLENKIPYSHFRH